MQAGARQEQGGCIGRGRGNSSLTRGPGALAARQAAATKAPKGMEGRWDPSPLWTPGHWKTEGRNRNGSGIPSLVMDFELNGWQNVLELTIQHSPWPSKIDSPADFRSFFTSGAPIFNPQVLQSLSLVDHHQHAHVVFTCCYRILRFRWRTQSWQPCLAARCVPPPETAEMHLLLGFCQVLRANEPKSTALVAAKRPGRQANWKRLRVQV